MRILKLIELIRPKQWIKNFFVFAPLLFAGELFHINIFIKSIYAFLAFSGVSSLVYIINDISDIESDKYHKEKRFRPLASGDVTTNQARIFFVVIFAITVLLCLNLSKGFIIAAATYFIINLLYSLKVKNIVLLDVFFISFGFMLRIIGGAAAISVQLSSWMILTAIFISLFLAISKRRAELSQNNNQNLEKQRKVLTEYDITFTDQMNTIAATGTIICYALYTVSEKAIKTFNTENLIYTTPFVIYGIFRYLYLIHKKNLGESPSQVVTKDLPLIINVFIWLVISIFIIYKPAIPLSF
jgi:4-hydroxybenzoate polyprenyltransferase